MELIFNFFQLKIQLFCIKLIKFIKILTPHNSPSWNIAAKRWKRFFLERISATNTIFLLII